MENSVYWLNLTGSGNETAAHVLENGRITIMFCAFEGKPLILRLYGTAEVVSRDDEGWPIVASHFPDIPGARQVFKVHVELVQTSCGFAVPFFEYQENRDQLVNWAVNKGEHGLREYWEEKNTTSLDGKPISLS